MKKSELVGATVLEGDWLTLAETVRAIGRSQSTVERLVGSGALKSKLEPRPGRKPERLYNADDVRRLADGHAPPNSRSLAVIKPPPESRLAVSKDTISAVRELMTEWRNDPQVPVVSKLWLTIDEAHAYSGRSRRRLLIWCREGKIVAVRDGGWRIKRTSLEAFAG
jgi:hypothetical protein